MSSDKDKQALQEIEAKVISDRISRQELGWLYYFSKRQRGLIANCQTYAENEPAGLQGHNVMIIVAKMAELLDRAQDWEQVTCKPGLPIKS